MDGQMSIFDFPEYCPGKEEKKKEIPKLQQDKEEVCKYSGHVCNRKQLWNVAYSLDEISCPSVCCRNCKENNVCGARCNGADSMQEAEQEEIKVASDEEKAAICQFCAWWDRHYSIDRMIKGCFWEGYSPDHLDEEEKAIHSCWMPNTSGMKVCATCEHSNCFIFTGDDPHNPVIDNDLYCNLSKFHNKHPENRRELFKEYRVKKEFGVGVYNRNHEYDTCDCWKPRHK